MSAKLEELAKTWDGYWRLSPDDRKMITDRLRSCDLCPQKKQLLFSGGIQHGGDNRTDSIYYCGSCGCGLWSRTKDPDKECPLAKWKAVE